MMGVGGSESETPEFRDLAASVGRYCHSPKVDRDPEDLGVELVGLRHLLDCLELDFSQTAAAFSSTNEWDRQGSTSSIDWIRHNCNMAASTTADRVRVGDEMAKMPRSLDAISRGQIGFAHLSYMAGLASAQAESAPDQPFDETVLLEKARQSSVGSFWHFCKKVRHANDPTGFNAEQQEAAQARFLRLSARDDGSVWLDGWLDSSGGAALRTALEPLAQPAGDGDDRCRELRMADALVDLATHALDSAQIPQRASQRPHLQVTATLETLRGLAGAPAADMEFSSPIGTRTVQRLACDATISRILLNPDSVVVDVGRSMRVVSAPTRRALNVRDGHCRWPGCDRPASWSAAHHMVHWICGGATNLDNLILLCHRHHTRVHEGGWQLLSVEDRIVAMPPPEPLLTRSARAPATTAAA
jgi:hypothetical protein